MLVAEHNYEMVYHKDNSVVEALSRDGRPDNRPVAEIIGSIFVDGSFKTHAEHFIKLLSEKYDVAVIGWHGKFEDGSRIDMTKAASNLVNGMKEGMRYFNKDKADLVVTFSSGLPMLKMAQKKHDIRVENLYTVASVDSFDTRWAKDLRNGGGYVVDELIENGKRFGYVSGDNFDKGFMLWDYMYGLVLPSGNATWGHCDVPIGLYRDYMELVRGDTLVDVKFDGVNPRKVFSLYGRNDYFTEGGRSIEPLMKSVRARTNDAEGWMAHREMFLPPTMEYHSRAIEFLSK